MRWRRIRLAFLSILVADVSIGGCRGRPRQHGPLTTLYGETVLGHTVAIGLEGRVYWLGQDTIQAFDVSNPRAVLAIGTASSGQHCAPPTFLQLDFCSLSVVEPFAFTSKEKDLARAAVPTNTGVDWVFSSATEWWVTTAVSSGIASGRFGKSIRFIAASSATPTLASELQLPDAAVRGNGTRLYAVTDSSSDMIIVDASSLTAPVQLGRVHLDMSVPGGLSAASTPVTADDRNVFMIAGGFSDSGPDPCYLNWFVLNSNLSSAERRSQFDGGLAECTALDANNGFVFVGSDSRQGENGQHRAPVFDVFFAASNGVLVRMFEYSYPREDTLDYLITDVVVDTQVGVVFVVHPWSLDLFDLGVVTTGQPRWP